MLVRIETSGLCHTDIHAARGDWPVKPTPPFVPGHEGVGIVERVGAGVTACRRGGPRRRAVARLGVRRVRVLRVGLGDAVPRASTTPATPSTAASPSTSLADAALRRPRPDGIDPLDAAPLTCAGVTTYKAVKVSGARLVRSRRGVRHRWTRSPGDAVRPDRRRARSPRSTSSTSKLESPSELGAEYTVNAAERGSGGGDPGPRRRRRRDRPGGRAEARSSRRSARSRRNGTLVLRRPARRQHHAAADLRDRAQGHHGHRFDRRHAGRPGRDVRAPRRRPHHGRPRGRDARARSTTAMPRSERARRRPGWSSTSADQDSGEGALPTTRRNVATTWAPVEPARSEQSPPSASAARACTITGTVGCSLECAGILLYILDIVKRH